MKLTFSGCCERGLARGTNEDAMLMRASENGGLFLVSDGIGGREYGEVVSGMLRDGYSRWWEDSFLPRGGLDQRTALRELKDVLHQINRTVVGRFGELTAGATLALLFVLREGCIYLSAGDSRIYRARRFSFQQVTVDDVDRNEGGGRPEAGGKLLGAIGIRGVPEFAVRTDEVRGGDRFFLCTDGVYRFVAPQKLQQAVLLGRPAPEGLIERLSQEIVCNGAGDNYSMIYIRVKSR